MKVSKNVMSGSIDEKLHCLITALEKLSNIEFNDFWIEIVDYNISCDYSGGNFHIHAENTKTLGAPTVNITFYLDKKQWIATKDWHDDLEIFDIDGIIGEFEEAKFKYMVHYGKNINEVISFLDYDLFINSAIDTLFDEFRKDKKARTAEIRRLQNCNRKYYEIIEQLKKDIRCTI